MGITHKTMESQRLLLRCFMLCTFVLWVGSCGDPHTGEVVSMDDTEQTKAVDKLTDLLHHEHKKSSISFSYSHSKATNLGEDSHKHAGAHKSGAQHFRFASIDNVLNCRSSGRTYPDGRTVGWLQEPQKHIYR